MRLLRDKAGLTRLLLLHELQRSAHTRLGDLAARVGITVQGVSQHMATLEREGLARAGRGRYELTPKGLAALQESLAELKGFVDLAWQRASVIDHCSALAGTRVREGREVGLFMEGGHLVARAGRPSPSRGTAAHDAAPGELVRVRGLEGLVALRPGRLTVLQVPLAPGKATGGAARALRRWLARHRARVVTAVGTEAQVLGRAAKVPDLGLFAPTRAAHHAAQLGLDAVVLASPDHVRFVTAEIDQLNEDALDPVKAALADLKVGR